MPMVELTAAVMAHPSRAASAARVAAASRLDCAVVFDPDPGGPPATLRTARAGWATAGAGTHHLLLQDDIDLAPGFAGQVRAAIEQHPDAALALFTEWGSRTADMLRVAATAGIGWTACADRYLPTQAVVLPTPIAHGFAGYAAALPTDTPDDNALLAYLRSQGVPALVKTVNLVEHLDLTSTVGNHPMGPRHAACYLPEPPAQPHPAEILPTPRLVPHLAWENGTAVYWITDPDVTLDWTWHPLRPLLAQHGLDDDTRATIWTTAGQELPAALRTGPHQPHLQALADVATALGLATIRCTQNLATGMVDTPAAQAWRTLAPGGLRNTMDPALLIAHEAELQAFVLIAAMSAAAAATAGTLRVLDCW